MYTYELTYDSPFHMHLFFAKKGIIRDASSPHCFRQKNILVAAEKKRFCDQRALHIVELLIEPVIDSAWLLHQVYQTFDEQFT